MSEHAELSVNAWSADYIEAMYARWRDDPGAVDARLRVFFEGFDLGASRADGAGAEAIRSTQHHVDDLVTHYRELGHLKARLDPLGVARAHVRDLDLAAFDLGDANVDALFDPCGLPLPNPSPLRAIIDHCEATYCRHVGVEYMHIEDDEQRHWLQEQMEPIANRPSLPRHQKMRILRELLEAEALERFLDLRYKGKKWFSLAGADALNPMLNELFDLGPAAGVDEFTMGMAHRGRINVLVNILQKSHDQLFTEFEESWIEDFIEGGGDVKYHKGFSSDYVTSSGESVRLTLSPNPSHLEFGHSVVLGRARSKQRLRKDRERNRCIPVLIHGDGAFPGQGIVAEIFNMENLRGYTVGGAIHVVVNNQVGFTTEPADLFSGRYCTDIGKMAESPIFHVNGDDPEACAYVAMLALRYRQRFHRDVIIDMWCYRQYGHNEGDEPMFTQPVMYRRIKAHRPVLETYADQLIAEGVTNATEVTDLRASLKEHLEASQARTREQPVETIVGAFRNVWGTLHEQYSDDPVETGVPREALATVSRALGRVPEGFTSHRRLEKLLAYRASAVEHDEPIDWGLAELLAYGTLLVKRHAVRLTGQDTERGTFSHRHGVMFDQETGERYIPLNHAAEGQERFCIYNSPLTESACLGFEYGYSLGDPTMLVIWEAQFGDFANGAQVIIDQFIASAEAKWSRSSGLTLLLPHGYEGQGPEHSSARLERFLTLCAGDNMQVVYPTTPAQLFHVMRRQLKRNFRKPLVIMSPKSLLRHPRCTSRVEDLVSGRFYHLLDDPARPDPASVNRLILCTGKVYYDLVAHREKCARDDIAIVRLEQLYPLRPESMCATLERYAGASEVFWVQEEPKNMGAWRYVEDVFCDCFDAEPHYIGRDANATPAVASTKMHLQEQERILVNAIGLPDESKRASGRRAG